MAPLSAKRLLFVCFSALAMALAVAGAVYAGMKVAGVGMSVHGFIALSLGAFFTLALSIGLFSLSFHSARHGHDAAVRTTDDPS